MRNEANSGPGALGVRPWIEVQGDMIADYRVRIDEPVPVMTSMGGRTKQSQSGGPIV
jgi:hypothetical protein